MSLNKFLIAGALFAAGFSAWADGANSEFFYQAPSGKSVFQAQAGFVDALVRGELDSSGNPLPNTDHTRGLTKSGLSYEYGLNDMISVQAMVTYTNLANSPADPNNDHSTSSGIDNVGLNFKGTSNRLSWGRLRYGILTQIGPAPSQLTAAGNENTSTGNFVLTPYVGTDLDMGPGTLGARVSYDLLKTDQVIHSPSQANSTLTGGQDFDVALFYELNFDQSLIGLSVDYLNESAQSSQNPTATTTLSGWSKYGANLYGRYQINETWAVIPSVGWDVNATKHYAGVYNTSGGDGISNFNVMNYKLAARYSF